MNQPLETISNAPDCLNTISPTELRERFDLLLRRTVKNLEDGDDNDQRETLRVISDVARRLRLNIVPKIEHIVKDDDNDWRESRKALWEFVQTGMPYCQALT